MTQRPVNPTPPSWLVDPLVLRALSFAAAAHEKQVRKYTGEPYIYHPIEVASTLFFAFPSDPPPPFVLAAALLHDVVEDCEVTFTELRREFGDEVATTVLHLTDLVTKEQGNRDTRKMMEVERLYHAPHHAQVIKLADMLSNTASITVHDPDFARVYMREKERAVAAIGRRWAEDAAYGKEVNDEAVALYNRAIAEIQQYRNSVREQ